MREVNLSGLDLNLLPALDALLRRRNVTRAAEDVGLSQPAMSRALGRLRDLLDDPLLVRGAGGLVLTPKAQDIAARLAPALTEVKRVFRAPDFDPRLAQRIVRIASVDTQTILYGPAIMQRLAREAPGVDLRFEPLDGAITSRMQSGATDFTFALSTTPLAPGAMTEVLADDRLALVLRRGHPRAKQRWRLEDYGEVEHAAISIFGDGQSEIDAALAAHGVRRRIAFVSPHFMATLAAVAATDLVTTVSRAFARRFVDAFDLVMIEPPLPDISLRVALVWDHLRTNDPLNAWMRSVIRDAAIEAHEGL